VAAGRGDQVSFLSEMRDRLARLPALQDQADADGDCYLAEALCREAMDLEFALAMEKSRLVNFEEDDIDG